MTRKSEPRVTHIAALELFAGCSESERRLIERLATVTEVKRGRELCRQGEIGRSFFVIVDGEATVILDGEERATLGPGCGFGEVALLRNGGRRIATVRAASSMTVVVFSRPEFATLIAEVPRLAREVLRQSEHRLSQVTGRDALTATS